MTANETDPALNRCAGTPFQDLWHSPVYFYGPTCLLCEALRQRNLLETQLYQLRWEIIQHQRGTPPAKALLPNPGNHPRAGGGI